MHTCIIPFLGSLLKLRPIGISGNFYAQGVLAIFLKSLKHVRVHVPRLETIIKIAE